MTGLAIEWHELTAEEAWERRRTPPDVVRRARLVAEHEAAHATVAAALGLDVGKVWTNAFGAGLTEFGPGDDRQTAIVAAAPAVWVDLFRAEHFPEGDVVGCSGDMARLRAVAFGAQDAARLAYRLLSGRRGLVLALAEQLLHERVVDYKRWRRGL